MAQDGIRYAVLGPMGILTSQQSQDGKAVGMEETNPPNPYDNVISTLKLSVREQLESAMTLIETLQTRFTLQPKAVTGYSASQIVRMAADGYAGLVYNFVIDAYPDCVGFASMVNGFNLTPFGQLNTVNNKITQQWMNNNVIPKNASILVGRNAVLQLGFTNLTSYEQEVVLTTQLGLVPINIANAILASAGLGQVS